MAYFTPYIDASGLHMPAYEDRLEELLSDYREIFGLDAALVPASPDYQLLSIFARALDDVSQLALQAYWSRSPQYAEGAALDLLAPLYGISRRGATCSQAAVTCSGQAGTVIPAGSLVSDTSGLLWRVASAVTIASGGSGEGIVVCETPGPVTAAAGAIGNIVTAVSGWLSVTNPAAAEPGIEAETDAELRERMQEAFQLGIGPAEAIRTGVMRVSGVTDCVVWVNSTGEEADGIPAHSIYAVVEGGTDAEVAGMILAKKAPGIGTSGDVTVAVADAWNVSREISFDRPETVTIALAITLSGRPSTEANTALRSALIERVNAMKIGETLYLSELYPICSKVLAEKAPMLYTRGIRAMAGQTISTEVIALPKNGKARLTNGGISIGY